jgi:eukaryotic-like serine/threonine-protein kinase
MTPERWAQVRSLFESALERPAGQRPAFLQDACASDDALLMEVRGLLDSFEESTDFMASPISAVAAVRRAAADTDALEGACVGPWKLLRRVGTGGMAAVYAAARIDQQFQKIVAIKVVKPGMDSEEILRRFRNERQVLASLDHPNIARLLDGGTTDYGLPYLVMEYVEGTPMDRYCDSHKLSISERLILFRSVCSAVQYAHQNLVVHRDLKPGNILVTAAGVPKLLDFGIAKLLRPDYSGQNAHFTRTNLRPMTPEYASPEQVRGEPITTATDVYSLGVVLYKLLTGDQPYALQKHTSTELERAICEWEPELPSVVAARSTTAVVAEGSPERLKRRLRGDLDVIVLTALRKEPQRRYASVQRLSDDIALHLGHAPVTARKDTWRYRTHKFLGRHKAGAIVTVLIALALVASTAVSIYFGRQAQKQKQMAFHLVSFMLGDFDAAIKSGATSARKAAQEEILGAVQGLSPNAAGDPELRKLLIQAYLKVGDLQGNPYETNLRDAAGAKQSYQKALELAEAARIESDVALVKLKLADIAFEDGERSAALDQYLKSRDILERIRRKDPRNAEALRDLTRVWYKIGLTQYLLGNVQEALRSYRFELELAGQWSTSPGAGSDARRESALAEEHVGEMLAKTGSVPEGIEHLRRGLATYGDLLQATPSSVTLRLDQALASLQTGDALMLQAGKLAEAEEMYRHSVGVLRSLVLEDPNGQYRRDLNSALSSLLSALQKNGEMQEARQVTVELLAGLHPLIDRPDPKPHDLHLYCWAMVNTPFKDLYNAPDVLRQAQKAVALTDHPDPAILNVLALAWEANGDLAKAAETERRALTLAQAGAKRTEIENNLASFEQQLAKTAGAPPHKR